ncbi:MAG TPA: alpha-glucan family phosphorylase, partial [Candidatus Atribacteria bacterium]|nr:alpha-glucan family phosphorylase [Candidatus Atribacteria bacterium]
GIGGVRALRALNIPVDIYHFNEGHAVLAGLELMNEKMNTGMSFDKAWESTRKEVIFTTHTPVEAGNEKHNIEALTYMGANLGFSVEKMSRIGGIPFNMTVAALRLSRKSNAVSKLHAKTANKMWAKTKNRSKIIGITNAIHVGTWVDERMKKKYLNLDEMWNNHQEIKKEIINFVKKRSGVKLNLNALLIGFSRRATSYKRSNLIFKDEKKLEKYLKDGKVQIIFSG